MGPFLIVTGFGYIKPVLGGAASAWLARANTGIAIKIAPFRVEIIRNHESYSSE